MPPLPAQVERACLIGVKMVPFVPYLWSPLAMPASSSIDVLLFGVLQLLNFRGKERKGLDTHRHKSSLCSALYQ